MIDTHVSTSDTRHGRSGKVACLMVLLAMWSTATGCSRKFYRTQADWDAYRLIAEKNRDQNWLSGGYRIDIDPRSRMYDPSIPDRVPMPPDDPAANRFLHAIDGKDAYPCWYKNGTTPYVDNPMWAHYIEVDEDGKLILDMNDAALLARLNSTDFQSNLEDLYLSALDVSFERFRFDTQFFGGTDQNATFAGRDLSAIGSASTLRLGHDAQARKLFASGGELVAGFANSLVWQFSGSDTYTANSLLDFTLMQPLLRAGSRSVVLETLTISERVLLYNIRQMERFRKGFYVQVTTGRNAGTGPQRRGGFFGGSGLTGFTGVGGGGFGGVGNVGGGGFAGGAGAAQAGGYLGLLQDQQQIRNQEANVAGLRDSLAQLQATYNAGRIDRFQVDLALQALYNAQSRLLSTNAAYRASLDTFKVNQLGLPPDVPLETNDRLLEQFNLIDPQLTAIQDRVGEVLQQLRSSDEEAIAELLSHKVNAAEEVRSQAAAHMAIVEEDLSKLDVVVPIRRRSLEQLTEVEELQQGNVDPAAYDIDAMEKRSEQLQDDFQQLVVRLEKTFGVLLNLVADFEEIPADRAKQVLIDTLADLSIELVDLMLVQARTRLETATLIDVNLDPHTAYKIALANRLDLMNARGNLVDTWRLIEFNANRLQSDVDIVIGGNLGTNDDNPFRFRNTSGSLRLGVRFDAPITRVEERNLYRQSLIEYQQARRTFYGIRDQVYQGLRNTLRTVELNKLNFELRRAAVLTAINQVEVTQLRLHQPPKPGEESQLGATTARDLVSALSDLLSVQNDFLSVWVNHEVQRVGLDFDLGTMRLDSKGLWIDPGPITGAVLHAPGLETLDGDANLLRLSVDDAIPSGVPEFDDLLPPEDSEDASYQLPLSASVKSTQTPRPATAEIAVFKTRAVEHKVSQTTAVDPRLSGDRAEASLDDGISPQHEGWKPAVHRQGSGR